MYGGNKSEMKIYKMLKGNERQGSAELILLIGVILIIIILVGNYIFQISEEMSNNLKELIEKQRDNLLYGL